MEVKKVKVYVPVILKVYGDDSCCELELQDGSISSEIDIIEMDAVNAYQSGDYMEVEND